MPTKEAIIADLQAHAIGAGLSGIVVPVWDSGGGRTTFSARHTSRISSANLNRESFW
jgi:hypothetical protein